MKPFLTALSFAAVAISALGADANGTPTYARDVARIVQKNCEGCHRPGQIGPFSLTNYQEVSAFAPEIKKAVQERRMPPWHAVPGHGDFKNERRLSDSDVQTLARWIDAGAPQGNRKDLPPPVKHNDDWALGNPDAVIAPGVSFEIEASGVDEYRCFVIPTTYEENRTIQAIEVRPGNRKVVHHVLVYSDTSGRARQLDAADPRPGYSCFGGLGFQPQSGLGGWAPGAVPGRLPDDVGRFLPKGADVVMQVHYHKNGKPETDRSSLGLHFNRQLARRHFRSRPILNIGIRIPPDAENHRETAYWIANQDLLAYSITPHMHLLGKEMLVTATFPDGTKKDLVWAKPYDFNWQTSYVFKEPFVLPKGTRIDVTGYFDNSAKNAKNPSNPLREVRWGEGTTDEMLIGWLGYIADAAAPASPTPARTSAGGVQ